MAPTPSKPSRKARTAGKATSDVVRPARGPKTTVRRLAFIWRHLKLRVVETSDYLSKGWTHLELTVVALKDAPCPLTVNGYLSHFLDAEILAENGGAVTFFIGWLDREAKTKAWAATESRWRQYTLF